MSPPTGAKQETLAKYGSGNVGSSVKPADFSRPSHRGIDEVKDGNDASNDLFFKVEGVKADDLYDWSLPSGVNGSHNGGQSQSRAMTGTLVGLNYKKIALFKYSAAIYAIDEECPHLGGPLHLGDIEVLADTSILCVVCPWHKWRMELDNGKVKLPRGRNKWTSVYPVKQDQAGNLWVGFTSMDERFFKEEMDF